MRRGWLFNGVCWWCDEYGSVSFGPYSDWDGNEIEGTAGKWWGWPKSASDCQADRDVGLWPMGPYKTAEQAMIALEEFDKEGLEIDR